MILTVVVLQNTILSWSPLEDFTLDSCVGFSDAVMMVSLEPTFSWSTWLNSEATFSNVTDEFRLFISKPFITQNLGIPIRKNSTLYLSGSQDPTIAQLFFSAGLPDTLVEP